MADNPDYEFEPDSYLEMQYEDRNGSAVEDDPDTADDWEDEDEDFCDGHESLRGDLMGATFYCDGSCK